MVNHATHGRPKQFSSLDPVIVQTDVIEVFMVNHGHRVIVYLRYVADKNWMCRINISRDLILLSLDYDTYITYFSAVGARESQNKPEHFHQMAQSIVAYCKDEKPHMKPQLRLPWRVTHYAACTSVTKPEKSNINGRLY